MSTAGKVLSVLVMLVLVVWIVMAAGVARLNTNGNTALHDLTVLRDRQVELERSRSQIVESLERSKHQFATVEESVKSAQALLEHRNSERDAEQKALADTRSEVKTLMADSSQLMNQLDTLRKNFQKTYHANVENLGKH